MPGNDTVPGVVRTDDHHWLGLHVFYAGNADPLLTGCIAPLVRGLRDRELIRGYFFIRYWLEGPHVRLRLLPAATASRATVSAEAETAIAAFIRREPAADENAGFGERDLHRRLFIAEYGGRKWEDTYGPTGTIPSRANNSIHRIPYEREYHRYGGPAGVELAEWHFERSSDAVLRILDESEAPGTAARWVQSMYLILTMAYALLRTDERVEEFFRDYRANWEEGYARGLVSSAETREVTYLRTADRLRHRLDRIRADAKGGSTHPAGHSPLAAEWLAHCRQLRERLVQLTRTGRILLGPGERAAIPATDPNIVLPALLMSYVHMTNNRLGVYVSDEVHVCGVLRASMAGGAERRAG